MYSRFLFFAPVSRVRDMCHLCPVVTAPSMGGVSHLPQCTAVGRSSLLSSPGNPVTPQMQRGFLINTRQDSRRPFSISGSYSTHQNGLPP